MLIFFNRYDNFNQEMSKIKLVEKEKYHFAGVITDIHDFRGNYFQIKVKVEKITNKQQIFSLQNQELYALVNLDFKLTNLQVGNQLIYKPYFTVDIFNNVESSYKNYLLQERVKFLNFANSQEVIVSDDSVTLLAKIKKAIFTKLKKYIPYPSYGLSYGLITGDKNYLAEEIKKHFRQTGTYHVLAVSGMHAGILFLFCFTLLRLGGLRKTPILIILAAIISPIYLFITDFQISIVRTYMMMVIYLFLTLLDKEKDLRLVLILTFNLVLFFSPQELHSLSFQLSFSAVWGIAFALDIMQKYSIKNFFLRFSLISLGAQFSTSAVLIYYFAFFNYLSIFYNFLVILLIPFIFGYTILLLISPLNFLNLATGQFISFLSEVIFKFLEASSIDLVSFHFPNFKGNFLLGMIIFLTFNSLGFIFLAKKSKKRKIK